MYICVSFQDFISDYTIDTMDLILMTILTKPKQKTDNKKLLFILQKNIDLCCFKERHNSFLKT